jgi:hypothetical protein
MKISTSPLKQIIKEVLFYRVFHRETDEKKEASKKKEETK